MIVITGAAGFIGSCIVAGLNNSGENELVVVDDFSNETKNRNLANKTFELKIHRNDFPEWLKNNIASVDLVIHMGARTDTTEFNYTILEELNLNYSKTVWEICAFGQIPLIYASSAATYGDGALGYTDDDLLCRQLHPLNPYGISKNEFDKYVVNNVYHTNGIAPPNWYGLKFFNVYGPNEYHKNRMASVIFHAYNQVNEKGEIKLFRSHRNDFKDGEQLRDFIYVKDVISVIDWLRKNKPSSGIYNLGTGKARSFFDLAKATAGAMEKKLHINWIDMPEDIRDKYQYFTEADMHKLYDAGYAQPFYSLEQGISDYTENYLLKGAYM